MDSVPQPQEVDCSFDNNNRPSCQDTVHLPNVASRRYWRSFPLIPNAVAHPSSQWQSYSIVRILHPVDVFSFVGNDYIPITHTELGICRNYCDLSFSSTHDLDDGTEQFLQRSVPEEMWLLLLFIKLLIYSMIYWTQHSSRIFFLLFRGSQHHHSR